jgi:spermidine synthase
VSLTRRGPASNLLVYVLFFVSGSSGLVYQIIWARLFGNIFGNNVYSAALVTAAFMSGLGIGSYVAGVFGDRRYASNPAFLLRAYALCEIFIAAIGLGLAALLPELEVLAVALSEYVEGADGWHRLSGGSLLWRYVVASVCMFPATFAMGATLTLMIRFLLRSELDLAGWRIGLLYGANTAGAALGSLLTDLALIPALGLFATQGLAAVLNLAAGVGALMVARSVGSDPTLRASKPESRADVGGHRRLLWATSLAVALSGFAAMGMEIVWFRFLVSLLGGTRAVLSLLLAVVLVGIWLGSVLGGALHRRYGHAAALFALAEGLFVLSTLGLLVVVDRNLLDRSTFLGSYPNPGSLAQCWYNLRPILLVAGLPSLLMGFAYPLANANVQQVESQVGRRAGLLYLGNTAGAVLGSLVVGFVFLTTFGMQTTVAIVAAVAVASMVAMGGSRPRSGGFLATAAAGLAVVVGATWAWTSLGSEYLLEKSFPSVPNGSYLVLREGINQSIGVSEIAGERKLVTNGHAMSGTRPTSIRYMQAFSHLPLLHMDEPESVLVICYGVGNTAYAASLHESVQRLDVADLSEEILSSSGHFGRWNANVLDDPRVSVYVNDGRHHLRMQPPATYDLVTLEPPPLSHAGVSSLYSRDFYELVKSRLKPGGFMSQWLPIRQLPDGANRSLVRAFIDVFPNSILVSGAGRELILLGTTDEVLEIDPAQLRERLVADPDLAAALRSISFGSLSEFVGSFVAGPETLERATQEAPAITDDAPILEHAVLSSLAVHRVPEDLFETSEYRVWCPRCSDETTPDLRIYIETIDTLYSSDFYLTGDRSGRPRARCDVPEVAALRASAEYLSAVVPCDEESETERRPPPDSD